LLASGATVYGAARDLGSITDDRIIPVRLDVTNDDQIAEAARRCHDVSIVVNNAGILRRSPAMGDGAVEAARADNGRLQREDGSPDRRVRGTPLAP
jgi:NADP-dependent 3-hydroxy acid dehydrogenase YdfG